MSKFYHTEAYNDRWIIEMIFPQKKNLFFVECGAVDGIRNSTCCTLEKEYNWHGICIEANPYNFEKLKKNRSAICINKPLDNISNKNIEFVITNSEWLCGIKNYTLSDPIKLKKFSTSYNIQKTLNLQTISLLDLLDRYATPKIIHYLSLDIEGAEYEVLKNFPFDKYIILAITVECPNLKSKWKEKFPDIIYDTTNEFNNKEELPCFKLLISKGYKNIENPYNTSAINEYYFILNDYSKYL